MTGRSLPQGNKTPMRSQDKPAAISGIFAQLASVWTFGVREFRMWRSYRMNQIMWINDILISSFLFFIIGKINTADFRVR